MQHMLILSYYVVDVMHIGRRAVQSLSAHDPNGSLEKEAPVGAAARTTKAEV